MVTAAQPIIESSSAVVATTRSVLIRWRRTPGLIEESLTVIEQERAAAFRRGPDAADFVAAHLLAREVAAGVLGVPAPAVQLTAHCPECGSARHGRPGIAGEPGAGISLSHAPGVVAAASGAGRVGIDVEVACGRLEVAELADVALAPGERALVPAAGFGSAFLSLWVRKEALVKVGATDLGSLSAVDLSGAGADGARWRGWALSGWAGDLPGAPGVVVALASRRAVRWNAGAGAESVSAAAELAGDRAP